MGPKRGLQDYIDAEKSESEEKINVQALIPKSIWDRAQAKREKDGLSWARLITGLLKAYLEL